MTYKKVIFLDIDGVLATVKQYLMKTNAKTYLKDYDVYPFDPKCVKVFNEILEKTDADIILSSDWRIFYTDEELEDIFMINGVRKSLSGVTKDLYEKSLSREEIRACEIKQFLNDNDVENYIILDDMKMDIDLIVVDIPADRFVWCDNDFEGIKKSGIKDKCLNKLNGNN